MAEDDPTLSSNRASNSEVDSSRELSKEISPVIKGDPSRDDPTHRSFMGSSRFATRHSWFMVLGLLAIGGMAGLLFHADQLLTKSLHQIRTASHLASLVSKIESSTMALNSDSRNFAASQDLRYAENYKKRSESLARDLKLLINDPAAKDNQKMAITLNDGVAQHAGHFSNIVKIQTLLGFEAEGGLSGNSRTSFAALEKRIAQLGSQLKSGTITSHLGNIKASELQLVQKASNKALQEIQVNIELLNKAIVASSLPDSEKKTAIDLLQSHRNDITQLARTRIALATEIARLGEISTYMAPSLDGLTNYTGNFSLLARQESKTTQEFIRQILAGGTGGTLILLIFFGYILMRSISKPTSQISEVAMELAHGNVSVPIPYLGNYDESGEISNALAIFRENMLHADRLRKDLEIALQQKAVAPDPEPLPPIEAPVDSSVETPADILATVEKEREEVVAPGSSLIPHSHNLPSVTEQPKIEEPEEVDAESIGSQLPIGKSAITTISQLVTETSKNASIAAEDAERTEIMVTGLDEAAEKIEDIEILMIGISDQMSLLAVQTALLHDDAADAENLIHLDEKRSDKKTSKRASAKSSAGQSVNDRIDTIQGGTKRAIKAVQVIGRTINEVNEVARNFAAIASKEALEAANELLRQSEDLRAMLDNLLGKVDTSGTHKPQTKARDRD